MSREIGETTTIPRQKQIDEALAALIASTKRVRRKLDLLEIADRLEVAKRGLGSLRAVAERIGLSTEMLRQFATVRALDPRVKRFVAERKIQSIDVAHRLSKLRPSEQLIVATALAGGELDSADARAIIALRRAAPRMGIRQVIERVKESRTIREYLVLFPVPADGVDESRLQCQFSEVVGDENIRSIQVTGSTATLAMNSQGRKRLIETARASGLTKRQLVERILAGRTGV